MSRTLPGIERIRARFVDLLGVRLTEIDRLVAEAGDDPIKLRRALKSARDILHQIGGTAGTLGYGNFGETARRCEEMIIAHLAGGRPPLNAVYRAMGQFAEAAEDLMRSELMERQASSSAARI